MIQPCGKATRRDGSIITGENNVHTVCNRIIFGVIFNVILPYNVSLLHNIPPLNAQLLPRYKLPNNLSGDVVLLQWHYVTGNSCEDVGYDQYSFPWATPDLPTCSQPLDVRETLPEQFWNCAEISIDAADDDESATLADDEEDSEVEVDDDYYYDDDDDEEEARAATTPSATEFASTASSGLSTLIVPAAAACVAVFLAMCI